MKRQLQQLQARARAARNQADELFIRIPFRHPLDPAMHRITLTWIKIERLLEARASACSQAR